MSFFLVEFQGVAFSAQGASQFGSFAEAFTQARVAAYIALQVIRRRPGAPEETIFRKPEDEADGALNSTTHSKKSNAIASTQAANQGGSNAVDQPEVKAILPKYEIDSTSDTGAKPENIKGFLSFKDVTFAYPTRPHEVVLNKMSTEIEAGKTVAFVGPRYDVHSIASI
jgi:ABC-type multidrug transport system fused ATPase/permease subunit